MSQKRPQREDGSAADDKDSRKSHSFRRVVRDVMNIQRLQNLMYPVLEPLVRRVVKEEVDSALTKYIINMKRNCEKDASPSESKTLQLQFVNALSLPVFTGTRIEGEGSSPIEVALVDDLSREVISCSPLSSARIEIVALEGDFNGDDEENWTLDEFASNIVREREGKKPLLTGDLILTLKDGIGLLGDLSFTDNSSWTRSRKFRLGARMIDDVEGVRIREAISKAFVVRDHRGELYKKHHPPHLQDEVWRLEKIGKDGALHKRLRKEGVNTVQDFLILLSLNARRLRDILGSGMSSKKWEITVEHAQTCVLDKTLHLYGSSPTSPQNNSVVFNAIGQVMGMFLNNQYVATAELSEVEKANARELVICAYANRDKMITLDESMLIMPASSSFSCGPTFLEGSDPRGSSSHEITTSNYPQVDAPSDVMQLPMFSAGGSASASASYEYCLNDMSFAGQAAGNTPFFDALLSASDPIKCYEEDYMLRTALEFSADLCNPPDASSSVPFSVHKARKDWGVLVWVWRWRCSIKRIIAKKSSRVGAMPTP
ncbi:calmodulin-binding protein 60 A [Andrographis paniculata]|uniref:calmodulin-binding protein 60 A n=1 Tax=Andrographis paniculata TaxID=175694 RepID=UPI0021E88589|nr:calmodulin-binding protein 60 A [Andrographis paniculata]